MLGQLPQEDLRSIHEAAFRELVRRTLACQPCFVGQNLSVEFDRHDVVLRGQVHSWYHKQVAQEAVRRVAGVGKIRNELTVAPENATPPPTFERR